MDFYGVNVQHGVDFFARDVYSSWLVVVGCSFVLIRLNVFGNFAAIGFDIQCTSFGSEGSDVVAGFIFGATRSERLLIALTINGRCGLFVCTATISLLSSVAGTT